MTELLENPLPAILGGIVLTVILVGSWLRTGYRSLGVAAIVVVIGAIGLVVLERVVVTDREQVEQTLDEIARDVELGNLPTILAHVHPEATDTRKQAEGEFPLYKITSVRIKSGVEIKLHMQHDPPEAQADFNVVVHGSDVGGVMGEHQVPRFAAVKFWKDGDRWKVRDYRHAEPTEGLRRRN